MKRVTRQKLFAVGAAVLLACSLALSTPVNAASSGVKDVCQWIVIESGKKILQCVEEAAGLYHDLKVQQENEEQAKKQEELLNQMKEKADQNQDQDSD